MSHTNSFFLDIFNSFNRLEVWLKVVVGGALLVATHAVLRRATSPRDASDTEEENNEESISQVDRRMTLVSEEALVASQESAPIKTIQEDVVTKTVKSLNSAADSKPHDIEESIIKKSVQIQEKVEQKPINTEDKELYSDEDEIEEEEEEIEVEVETKPKKEESKPVSKPTENVEPDEEDDVEIIDEEEVDEEDVEEEISDVDDAELLNRLEAKYGRLPEPDRFLKQSKNERSCIRLLMETAIKAWF